MSGWIKITEQQMPDLHCRKEKFFFIDGHVIKGTLWTTEEDTSRFKNIILSEGRCTHYMPITYPAPPED